MIVLLISVKEPEATGKSFLDNRELDTSLMVLAFSQLLSMTKGCLFSPFKQFFTIAPEEGSKRANLGT